jgi:hypothetical protein
MALTVSINHPQFPDDTEFGVAGAFVVPNGGSVELTEEQESAFAVNQQKLVSDALGSNEMFDVSGSGAITEIPAGGIPEDRTPEQLGFAPEDREAPEALTEEAPAPEPTPEGGEM